MLGVNGTGDEERGEGVVGVLNLHFVSASGDPSGSLRFSLTTRGAEAGVFPAYFFF